MKHSILYFTRFGLVRSRLRSQGLVPQEEPAGDLVRPPVPEGQEPVLEQLVVPAGRLVDQELEVVQEQVVVQEQSQRRGVVPAENINRLENIYG